ncbi:glycosyltransferase [Tateyamaria sp.]|uniref:glycosyltransferase n=1 Tax=Tateyamaria sp. TaxID=1929288 RepID=UPI003B210E8A
MQMKVQHMTIDPSASQILPEGISQVVISDGRVFAQTSPTLAEQELGIEIGAQSARLGPVPEADQAMLAQLAEYRPTFTPPQLAVAQDGEEALNKLCEMSLNGMPQWQLPGCPTLQIKYFKPGRRCRVPLVNTISLPANAKPMKFRAHLASHRASGKLVLQRRYLDEKGVVVECEKRMIRFDATKQGGSDPADYVADEVWITPCEHETELHMTLVYEGFDGADPKLAPFMFLADPHVVYAAAAKDDNKAFVLKSDSPAAADAVWLCSALPALMQARDILTLLIGEDSHPLLVARDLKVSLLEDHGHSMQLQASEPGFCRFVVDGKLAFMRHMDGNPAWIRMPAELQTGQPRHLEVLDETGTQKLLDTFVLMPRLLTPMDVLHTESRRPFPGALMPAASHRYAALKAHMEDASASPEDQAQIAYALRVVEGGHKNVKLKPLHFPKVENPDVSIVIPAHNKVEITYLALASLLLAHNEATFEVILVDDASTDETAELDDIVTGITIIHNKQAQRFIRACNAGADKARGRYVALLNNDVEVTSGWLDELVAAFGRFDNVGLVGSKLLYPDGRLQDAGGLIWGTGNPWNYGNGQNPWDPRFCYARQADYLCGAAMMTSKEIWDQIGGLSSYLEPMYFEDTDFAFKVREAGYTTWFIPSSVVYHFEGMTSGTSTSSGFKRFQEVNRPKFKRRWAKDYAGHGAEGHMPDLEKDRGIVGRVLFIDYATPRPDRDAGSHAAIQEIRLVQSLGYKVTFLPNNLAHLGDYTDELEKMGVEVIYAPFFLSVDGYLTKHAAEFDAFFITRFYVARDVIDRLRDLAPEAKILFNNADLHFLRELRAGVAASDQERIEAARRTREVELDVMRKTDVVLSYNEVEHSVIQSHTDGAVEVVQCPWVVEMPEEVPAVDTRAGLSFLGNYLHAPNAEGAIWFCRQVMPLLESEAPDLTFHIYGSAMSDEIKALESDAIQPQGFVEDLADAYDQHRIFVAPLLSGAGIKGKVLAALAHGVPCVLTPTAAEGIGLRHGHDCLIATTPGEWRDAILKLQGDDDLWQKLSDNARGYVRQTFSFETGRGHMRTAFETVDLYSPVD